MPDNELNNTIKQGISAMEKGNTLTALIHFENAARRGDSPVVRSYLAVCLAKERRQVQKAVALCTGALQEEPNNPVHYLNLGRIYLLAGQKNKAILTWRRGLRFGRNQYIVNELKHLGMRRPPVLESLGREHPLNRYLGILFKKLGIR